MRSPSVTPAPSTSARTPLRVWLWLTCGVAVALLLAAGVAAASLSAAPEVRVRSLQVAEGGFYASVSLSLDDFRTLHWGRSTDGGATWTGVDEQDVPRAVSRDNRTLICIAGRVCYRYNPYFHIVERRGPHDGWLLDFASTEPLDSLVVNPADDAQAMVILDHRQAARRAADGTWSLADFAAVTTGVRWESGLARFLGNPLTTFGIASALCAVGLGWGSWRESSATLWVVVNASVAVLLTLARSTSSVPWWPMGVWIAAAVAFLAVRQGWRFLLGRAGTRGGLTS